MRAPRIPQLASRRPTQQSRETAPGPTAPIDALAVVGHELRSPLAALRISADLLADEIDTHDRQARADLLGAIQRRTRALHTLVDNLLHSAGRRLTLEYHAFEAEDLIADVKLTVLPLLAQKDQRLSMRGVPPRMLGDRPRLVQVLVNLILNASKFSPASTAIDVAFTSRGPILRIEVADRGSGLPVGALDWLFEPYARAQTGAAGIGLGLSIVRSIAEAHGGQVGALNRPGGGARFWFSIPTTARLSVASGGPDAHLAPHKNVA